MDGLNLAALTQKASKKKILTIPKDGGLFNGLLLYKRMRQFKKQVYLGIGFRINARSLESLKTLSDLTTGISKYVVLSKPSEFTLGEKCTVFSDAKRNGGKQEKHLIFTFTYNICKAVGKSLGLDQSLALGYSFAYNDYNMEMVMYFAVNHVLRESNQLAVNLKTSILNSAMSKIDSLN